MVLGLTELDFSFKLSFLSKFLVIVVGEKLLPGPKHGCEKWLPGPKRGCEKWLPGPKRVCEKLLPGPKRICENWLPGPKLVCENWSPFQIFLETMKENIRVFLISLVTAIDIRKFETNHKIIVEIL